MNSTTYILTGGTASDTIYVTGTTHFTLSFANILSSGNYSGTTYNYLKCLVKFSDSDVIYTVSSLSNWYDLQSKSLTHDFYPTDKYVTSHTIAVTGFRTDLTADTYDVTLRQSKTDVLDYGKYKIINTQLMTNDSGINNLLVTLELQDPRQVANIVIPYDKVSIEDIAGTGALVIPIVEEADYLRTEYHSRVGGFESIVTENDRTYIIRERALVIIVIGTEKHGHESTSGTLDEIIMGTINHGSPSYGDTLILVPEDVTYLQEGAATILNRGRETYTST